MDYESAYIEKCDEVEGERAMNHTLRAEVERLRAASGDLMNDAAKGLKERRDLERNLADSYEEVARLEAEVARLRAVLRTISKLEVAANPLHSDARSRLHDAVVEAHKALEGSASEIRG